MYRNAILKLRTAINTDFANADKSKKVNVPYFCKGANGEMQNKMYFFNAETNMNDFKLLYSCNQIFVFADPNEPVHHFNCIDWDFIDQQLDYELKQQQYER